MKVLQKSRFRIPKFSDLIWGSRYFPSQRRPGRLLEIAVSFDGEPREVDELRDLWLMRGRPMAAAGAPGIKMRHLAVEHPIDILRLKGFSQHVTTRLEYVRYFKHSFKTYHFEEQRASAWKHERSMQVLEHVTLRTMIVWVVTTDGRSPVCCRVT